MEHAYYVGQWLKRADGSVAQVRNRGVEEDGSVSYLFDGMDWEPESAVQPVEHGLEIGAAVKIATPTTISGPSGTREERDDTPYRVMVRHFSEDGEPQYALGRFVRGEWVQVLVVGESHLAAIEDDSGIAPWSTPAVEAIHASSSGVMETSAP